VELPVAVRRPAYRAAYRVLQVWWFVTRPQKSGVKCVLTDGEQVLLVRHTYGRRYWDVPGGSVKRGEPPLRAARREMREELGVDVTERIPTRVHLSPANARYLAAKAGHGAHTLELPSD